jgi:hypothetical protein
MRAQRNLRLQQNHEVSVNIRTVVSKRSVLCMKAKLPTETPQDKAVSSDLEMCNG